MQYIDEKLRSICDKLFTMKEQRLQEVTDSCDLLENEETALPVAEAAIKMTMSNFEIKTLKIAFE